MRLIPNEFLELICRDNSESGSAQQAPWHDSHGQSVEQRDLLIALNTYKGRYNELLRAAADYTYTVTVENGAAINTTHSATCIDVTGYSSDEYKASPYLWLEMVHLDDRDLVLVQASNILNEQESSAFEHRIYHKDGSLKWIQNIIIRQYDADGRLCAYDGLVRDITAQKTAASEKDGVRDVY